MTKEQFDEIEKFFSSLSSEVEVPFKVLLSKAGLSSTHGVTSVDVVDVYTDFVNSRVLSEISRFADSKGYSFNVTGTFESDVLFVFYKF